MYDKTDFIIKEYKSNQRKKGKAKHKLYRIICDECQRKQNYGLVRNKKNYCKKCQYIKLSNLFTKKIFGFCVSCGKRIERTKSQWKRATNHFCSNKCIGLNRRKNITEVARAHLKNKLLQEDKKPECKTCGHRHIWNLQAHLRR